MNENTYTGIEIITAASEHIADIFESKKILASTVISGFEHLYFENTYVIMQDESNSSTSALAIKKGRYLHLLSEPQQSACGIFPKNAEQRMAFDALFDPKIRVVMLPGLAGSGKSLMAIAAAVQQIHDNKYSKLIYSRIMSQSGHYDIGTLPGDLQERYDPYLQAFHCNAALFTEGKKNFIKQLIREQSLDFIPAQLFRGASFNDAFIIMDEIQTLTRKEMLTVGTRVGPGSKIVFCGDLNQRDENITRQDTGLHAAINRQGMKDSPLVSVIELVKSERGPVSALFSEVFNDVD